MLETFELTKFFAGVVAGDTLATRKPSPEPLHRGGRARRRGGAGKAAMVGDSPIDADAARARPAIPFVAVSFGYSPVPATQLGADAVIDGFDALAGALDGIG